MSLRKKLAEASLVGSLLATSACGKVDPKSDPYEAQISSEEGTNSYSYRKSSRLQIERIQSGDFFQNLPDGAYRITFEKSASNTISDLNCVLIKDQESAAHESVAYSGLDCDWVSANTDQVILKPAP